MDARGGSPGAAVSAIASSGNSQTVTLGPEGVTQSEGLGRAFQTFSILGGTPGIAAARYYSDFDLNSFQLPISHSFDPIEGGFLSGVAPYAEITLGYLTGSQTFPLTSDGNSPTSVKLSFNAWSALAGGGIDVPWGAASRSGRSCSPDTRTSAVTRPSTVPTRSLRAPR